VPPALALAALLALVLSAAPALGSHAAAACSATRAGAGHGVRACAGRTRKAHRHAKVKRHHAKHLSIKKKKAAPLPVSPSTPLEPLHSPASCEDATHPARAGDGTFTCGDGSEPVCANGLEPVASSAGTAPSCPIVGSAGGWRPAACGDGSAPAPAAAGGYVCADESEPECEDGSDPVPAGDGSMPVCAGASAAVSSPGAGRLSWGARAPRLALVF